MDWWFHGTIHHNVGISFCGAHNRTEPVISYVAFGFFSLRASLCAQLLNLRFLAVVLHLYHSAKLSCISKIPLLYCIEKPVPLGLSLHPSQPILAPNPKFL